jgi:hypothetical protein
MVRAVVSSIVLVVLLCAGCGQEGPTYAEAVQLYTVEMQELQRLQAERARIQQSSEVDQVLADLKGGSLLGMDVNVSKEDLEALQAGRIDKLGDRPFAEAEFSQWYAERAKRGEQLKDLVAETEAINKERKRLKLPIEPGIARQAKAYETAAAKTKTRDEAIAKLDAQITVQQGRVDRARAVKDEIEARNR